MFCRCGIGEGHRVETVPFRNERAQRDAKPNFTLDFACAKKPAASLPTLATVYFVWMFFGSSLLRSPNSGHLSTVHRRWRTM